MRIQEKDKLQTKSQQGQMQEGSIRMGERERVRMKKKQGQNGGEGQDEKEVGYGQNGGEGQGQDVGGRDGLEGIGLEWGRGSGLR